MSNMIEVVGVVVKDAELNNEVGGCRFYRTEILSRRESGIEDVLPVIVTDYLVSELVKGETVYIRGTFRSFNDKPHGAVRMYIYVEEVEHVDVAHMNGICLDGFICKPPVLRRTPKGKTICDLLVAVHRNCGQSDYIPCVLWNRNAMIASGLRVGDEVKLRGRIQRRLYEKKLGDRTETRIAYEVSVSHLGD